VHEVSDGKDRLKSRERLRSQEENERIEREGGQQTRGNAGQNAR
jgi:transposase-like protein